MNPYHRVHPVTGIEYVPAPGDQSVCVFLGEVLVGQFEATATWNLRPEPTGMHLEVFDISPLLGHRIKVKGYPPGEWSTIKRGAD